MLINNCTLKNWCLLQTTNNVSEIKKSKIDRYVNIVNVVLFMKTSNERTISIFYSSQRNSIFVVCP